jgi:hypothetical protein
MSMKRSKARSFGPKDDGDGDDGYFKKKTEPEKTYEQHMEGKTDEMFAPYSMASKYEMGALVNHSKFGKGVIVAVEASRVEVLFADGKKKLGHATPG